MTRRPRVHYCRQGHRLILGKTAYQAFKWAGEQLCMSNETGCLIVACLGSCRFGDRAAHLKLEGAPGHGGTRHVGRREKTGEPLWQHRLAELRCRECNRERVAAHRAKKKAVIGNPGRTNYKRAS